jgi:glyoxylase-like metal-dependent hydrolase (beta-lactamase superfamily II)
VRLDRRSGKRLAYIYITHGHGDHWFGTAQVMERFPSATVYATDGTIRKMHQQADSRPDYWDENFPGQIGDTADKDIESDEIYPIP